MGASSSTRVVVFDHYVVQLVDAIDAGEHRHGVYQLSISLDGHEHRCGPSRDRLRSAHGHLVAPNTPHCLDGRSGQQVLFLVAPQSAIARRLGARYLDDAGFGTLPPSAIDADAVRALRPAIDEGWSAERIGPPCDALLATLSDAPWSPADDVHPAVHAAIDTIHERLGEPISADDLARSVGLSTSRLLHLFRDQMGTPLRPHIRWLRLSEAMVRLAEGTSITEAAARAGFADGPHLTRSMRELLGLRPSEVLDHPDITIELCLTGRGR